MILSHELTQEDLQSLKENVITLSHRPITRSQLSKELGLYRTSSFGYLLNTIKCLLDDAHVQPRSPLDDYVVWLLRRLSSEPYIEPGRKPGMKRLKRKKIEQALIENPEEFSPAKYCKSLKGDRQEKAIQFTYIKQK